VLGGIDLWLRGTVLKKCRHGSSGALPFVVVLDDFLRSLCGWFLNPTEDIRLVRPAQNNIRDSGQRAVAGTGTADSIKSYMDTSRRNVSEEDDPIGEKDTHNDDTYSDSA
jgi:hypothetical protein